MSFEYNDAMALPDEKPLEGWKDIAKYLGRGERTAQRCEHKGLPVHRHDALGVIAYKSEINIWIANLQEGIAALPDSGPVAPDFPSLPDGVTAVRRSRR